MQFPSQVEGLYPHPEQVCSLESSISGTDFLNRFINCLIKLNTLRLKAFPPLERAYIS